MQFLDRTDAGRQLAAVLTEYKNQNGLLVLAIPRGGVPVAYEVAEGLNAPLDVFLVRKLGVPGYRELAFGAIARGDVLVLNDGILKDLSLNEEAIAEIIEQEKRELARREALYRGEQQLPPIGGRTVILVDDGLATGASMRAAVNALKVLKGQRIIIAVPVSSREAYQELNMNVEKMVCLQIPSPFISVGSWYKNFEQTSDEEVIELLKRTEDFGR